MDTWQKKKNKFFFLFFVCFCSYAAEYSAIHKLEVTSKIITARETKRLMEIE